MKHLPDLFETWNRIRGHNNKIGAQAVFVGVFAILYALVHPWGLTPSLTLTHLTSWMHYSPGLWESYASVQVGFIAAILIMFQWFWFSDRWPHENDTLDEAKRPIMDAYADYKMGKSSESCIAIDLEELVHVASKRGEPYYYKNFCMWKGHSFTSGWTIKCFISLGLVGLLAGCYSWALIGAVFGYKTGRAYYKHFIRHTVDSIPNAEFECGRYLGWVYYTLMIEPIIYRVVG